MAVASLDLFAAETSAINNNLPKLTIELRDGSRVVGKSLAPQMQFHSTLLGDFSLAMTNIQSLRFDATNSVKLTAANGDILNVQWTETQLPLQTSFGKVELTTQSIRTLQVSQDIFLEQIFPDGGDKPCSPFHVAYIVPAGTVGNQNISTRDTQTMGNDFEVNEPIKIVALGVFDSGGDGLVGKLHARIYDRDTQTSLADIEFTPENPGMLAGGSRFLPLEKPLVLKRGFHGIIAVAYLGTTALEPDGNMREGVGNWTTDGNTGALSFVGMGCHSRAGSGDAFPYIEDPSPMPNNFAAGTFIYERVQ